MSWKLNIQQGVQSVLRMVGMLNLKSHSRRACQYFWCEALCSFCHVITIFVSTGSQHLLQPLLHRVQWPNAAAQTVHPGHRPHTLLWVCSSKPTEATTQSTPAAVRLISAHCSFKPRSGCSSEQHPLVDRMRFATLSIRSLFLSLQEKKHVLWIGQQRGVQLECEGSQRHVQVRLSLVVPESRNTITS